MYVNTESNLNKTIWTCLVHIFNLTSTVVIQTLPLFVSILGLHSVTCLHFVHECFTAWNKFAVLWSNDIPLKTADSFDLLLLYLASYNSSMTKYTVFCPLDGPDDTEVNLFENMQWNLISAYTNLSGIRATFFK